VLATSGPAGALQYASEQRGGCRRLRQHRASVGAIQRSLLTLEQEGGAHFFGEPALDLRDFMRADFDGRAFVNILAADRLMMSPRLYATFLLWLLSELFEEMPEVGDPDKPRLVFFFDEAHLLFEDAPKALVDKVEQVVRLIRSKGVGVYFVTQNPLDIPEDVLGQLGNRVQHALRAFTPRDTKAVRPPTLSAQQILPSSVIQPAAGAVSTLEQGVPSIVQRTRMPAVFAHGTISDEERKQVIAASPIGTPMTSRSTAIGVRGAADPRRTKTGRGYDADGRRPRAGGRGHRRMIGGILGTSRHAAGSLPVSASPAR
jgi:hypothetical protein